MAKYLLLKHYRGAPAPVNDVPMDRWTPDEVDAHITYMNDFAARLERSGEFVDGQALSPDGVWVRYDGEGRPPVTDGPFAETRGGSAGVWPGEGGWREGESGGARRCPNPTGEQSVLELRPGFEAEDFGEEFTPELREQEERLRAQTAAQHG